ncbi:MAG: 50S ribosomal protein L4 [Phycisphaerae bacterium]|nr:50S ribosomal protein L4 [Phycisphaerae bacterium]
MISVPVVDMQGKAAGSMEIDPALLGGRVRVKLLKQAIVAWQSNQRQGSARTKSRGMVVGSTRKLYRQKGTGNARAGTLRTNVRRGGGVAFAKGEQNWRKDVPRRMRRLARNSAILAKLTTNHAVIVKDLSFETPKTRVFAQLLKAIGAERGALVALDEHNEAVYRSGRNIPRTEIRVIQELNACEVLRRPTLVFSQAAFEVLRTDPVGLRAGRVEQGDGAS